MCANISCTVFRFRCSVLIIRQCIHQSTIGSQECSLFNKMVPTTLQAPMWNMNIKWFLRPQKSLRKVSTSAVQLHLPSSLPWRSAHHTLGWVEDLLTTPRMGLVPVYVVGSLIAVTAITCRRSFACACPCPWRSQQHWIGSCCRMGKLYAERRSRPSCWAPLRSIKNLSNGFLTSKTCTCYCKFYNEGSQVKWGKSNITLKTL